MDVLKPNILELPKGLVNSNLYKLLSILDTGIIEHYNQKFTPSDEYHVIREAVEYFYTSPERDDEDNLDEEAREIDLNFLAMTVLAGKSTREFLKVFLSPERLGLFYITGDIDTAIQIEPENPYDLIFQLDTVEADDANDAVAELEGMINFLLYFHELILKIRQFTQRLPVEVLDTMTFNSQNNNAAYYEVYK